jgi:hypothetical protein
MLEAILNSADVLSNAATKIQQKANPRPIAQTVSYFDSPSSRTFHAHTIVGVWELMIVLIGSIDFVTGTMPFTTDPARAVSSLMRLLNHTVGTSPNMMLAAIDNSATNFQLEIFIYTGVFRRICLPLQVRPTIP